MNLLEMVLAAQGGGGVQAMARSAGVREDQAQAAIEAMLPALARGLKNNMASQGGLESLLGALAKGGHQRYVDDPSRLSDASSIADGNAILGHILGSKDVSRQVANGAAARTGLDPALLKKMLPMIAALAMGALSRQAPAAGGRPGVQVGARPGAQPGGDLFGGLGSMLDIDKDGSVLDDIASLAQRFLR
jgi:hypothetical protein